MNGTLTSHPPGGGGSGSSVTNGGPASAEPDVIKKAITIPANQGFMWHSFPSDKINRDSEQMHRSIIYLLVLFDRVSLRIRPSAGSIRYAVSPLPATTPRTPLTVGTVALKWNFPRSSTSAMVSVAA